MDDVKTGQRRATPGCGMALLALVAWASPALAQQQGDLASGERIARTWCSNCHVIGAEGSGPANDAAPTFASIARMPSTTAMSLRAFLQTPHDRMPDYQFARDEMDDVIAYLLSLDRR